MFSVHFSHSILTTALVYLPVINPGLKHLQECADNKIDAKKIIHNIYNKNVPQEILGVSLELSEIDVKPLGCFWNIGSLHCYVKLSKFDSFLKYFERKYRVKDSEHQIVEVSWQLNKKQLFEDWKNQGCPNLGEYSQYPLIVYDPIVPATKQNTFYV